MVRTSSNAPIDVSVESMLPLPLVERVLVRLGFARRLHPTFDGLRALYGAWCRHVPFDNVLKIIHLRSGNPGPLPGTTPLDYFECWLKFGTGGTCWAGAGALHALLVSLGFDAERGIGTMLAAPNLPPNHGTVRVRFGPDEYLVDSSILHGEPLLLRCDAATQVNHPAWGVRCTRQSIHSYVSWRPLNRPDGFQCRLDRFGAASDDFDSYYESTRGWSPFNYEAFARLNRCDDVIGLSFGYAVTLRSNGSVDWTAVSQSQRRKFLIEEIGLSEEVVCRLPDDLATPPPPGSRTAAEAL